MTVVVGVDGAGRTRRLGEIVAAMARPIVGVDDPSEPSDQVTARLDAAVADGAVVVVDDAHRLPASTLRALTRAARNGAALVVSRRPTIGSPELAELDELAAAAGGVELLEPLDEQALAALTVGLTGRPSSPEDVRRLLEASAGLPALAVLLVAAPAGTRPPALVVRVQQRLARLEPAVAAVARILALRLGLADDVLHAACGISRAELAHAMRALRDAGLLVPGGEAMIPAVAEAVLAELPPAERRRLHDAVAGALVAAGEDPVAAAAQLSAAGARSPAAATVYTAAADRLRFDDPATAVAWYDQALVAGADPTTVAAGRAEAAVLLGRPATVDVSPATSDQATRSQLLTGAAAAHQGRLDRAAEALLAAGPTGQLLAVPALVAVGRMAEASAAVARGDRKHGSLTQVAEAALAVNEPDAAVPLFIEAAEELERSPPAVVLPDTPHAMGAIVAVLAGDVSTAEHLLERATAAGVGGPAAGHRHRALLAWARLRAGRLETAVGELPRLAGLTLPDRERLLVAALSAGIARRSGDIAQLRDAWALAGPVLARQTADLFVLEPLEELLVAAARLREHRRIAPVVDALDAIVDRLGRPSAWAGQLGWIRLQVAVAADDAEAVALAASRVEGAGGAPRIRALAAAAEQWARSLGGDPDADSVEAAAAALATAELPWEASRLVGQAAIRVAEPATARRLLERARELASTDASAVTTGGERDRGMLSDRELEVARLVLAGHTYKEIGAQLYLSPKTVEHHVARIRTKLGATSRAELLAMLQEVMPDEP